MITHDKRTIVNDAAIDSFSNIRTNSAPRAQNPLVCEINGVLEYVDTYRERVRGFFYQVILSPYSCPICGSQLIMTGTSECTCRDSHRFDPTVAFQSSPCCQSRLIKKTFHYACSRCHKTVPSRFLFDERVFDTEYFREMMREHRDQVRSRREEIRRLLAESRSGALFLTEKPQLDSLPNLIQDLNSFILGNPIELCGDIFDTKSDFRLAQYRDHILSSLGSHTLRFSDISPLSDDRRQDMTRRFITLVFMDNDREVNLQQYGDELLIQRCNNAYAEG